MFFKSLDNPIGLDISDLSVKMVQLARKGPELSVHAYSDTLLPEGIIESDVIKNKQGLADFIKMLFKDRSNQKGKLMGRSIVASVPESKAFVRVIAFPKMSPEELVSAVPLEAEQYIPLPIGEMQVDWAVVGESSKGLNVLITATPKSYIKDLIDVFNAANLVPQAIEVESAAVVRAVIPRNNKADGATIILDLNAHRTSLIVWADNSIQFTFSIPVGGSVLTSSIAKRLNLSLKEAEQVKRLHGVPLQKNSTTKVSADLSKMLNDLLAALEPSLSNIYDEVKNTIKFHEGHGGPQGDKQTVISKIVLCGGTSKLPFLADYFQNKIGQDPELNTRNMQVMLADPWQNIFTVSTPPFSRRDALSYSTAIGLALRNYL